MTEAVDSLAAWTDLLAQMEERTGLLLLAVDSDDALAAVHQVRELVVPPQCGALPAALAARAAALLERSRTAEAALAKATAAVGRELAMLGRMPNDQTATPLYVDVGM